MALVKLSFFTATVLYSLAALFLVGGGCFYGLKVKEITDLRQQDIFQFEPWNISQVMPWIYVCVGILAFVVSTCGLFGAGTNSKEGLSAHIIFLSISLCLFIGMAVTTMAVVEPTSETFINETIKHVFEQVKLNKNLKESFGDFEQSLPCCGASGPQDYIAGSAFGGRIPESCCTPGDQYCLELLKKNDSHRKGCIYASNAQWYRACVGGTVVCCLATIFGLISLLTNIVLYKALKKDDELPEVKIALKS